jgi:hypothetical protein
VEKGCVLRKSTESFPKGGTGAQGRKATGSHTLELMRGNECRRSCDVQLPVGSGVDSASLPDPTARSEDIMAHSWVADPHKIEAHKEQLAATYGRSAGSPWMCASEGTVHKGLSHRDRPHMRLHVFYPTEMAIPQTQTAVLVREAPD